MRIAALVLGIIGGLGGFIGAIIALAVGTIGSAFGKGNEVSILATVAIFLAILGIIGGALALAKPKLAGILMLISAIGGIICISAAYAFGGPLLIVGAILALIASRRSPAVPVVIKGQDKALDLPPKL